MSPLSPVSSTNRRAVKVLATVLAAILAIFVMNTARGGSDESATTLSTQSLLTLPGGAEPTSAASPTAIPTTAPFSLPTPTTAPLPTATPLPSAAPTARAIATPTDTPAAPTARSAPGEVSVADAGSTAGTASAEPAPPAAADPTAPVAAAPTATEAPPAATAEATATPLPEPTATIEPIDVSTPEPTATAVPTPTPTAVPVQTVAQLEAYVLGEINQVRADAGLGPIALDSSISAISRDWSQHMASTGLFEHRPGSELNVMLPAGWLKWGENIASAPDIFWAQSSLEASPGHYENMVGPFTHVGIGVYSNGTQVWVTQNFARY